MDKTGVRLLDDWHMKKITLRKQMESKLSKAEREELENKRRKEKERKRKLKE